VVVAVNKVAVNRAAENLAVAVEIVRWTGVKQGWRDHGISPTSFPGSADELGVGIVLASNFKDEEFAV
jgi:hypothetical protein